MIGFYLHLITETPAIFSFLFSPSMTLAQPQPYASPLIRQYGVLLAVTSLILISVMIDIEHRAKMAHDDPYAQTLRERMAGALAVYHLAPTFRAIGRLGVHFRFPYWVGLEPSSKEVRGRTVEKGLSKAILSSPLVHMMLHGVCCALLVDMAFGGEYLH